MNGAATGNSNIQALGQGGLYGTHTVYGGGGGGITHARDALDFARMGSPGQIPDAQYPDGYLGGLNSRRSDRLLTKIGSMNRRAYTRGVHRGERIDPGDYAWPENWTPTRGIEAQMRGERGATLANSVPEPRLVNRGTNLPPQIIGQVTTSLTRERQMSHLMPRWGVAGASNPSQFPR